MMTTGPGFVLENRSGVWVATVQASDLSVDVIGNLRKDVESAIAGAEPARLILDASAVKFINSVALGGLVALLRRVKSGGGRMAVAGLGGHCLKVMEVTCMDRVFEMYGDVAWAMETFTQPTC